MWIVLVSDRDFERSDVSVKYFYLKKYILFWVNSVGGIKSEEEGYL